MAFTVQHGPQKSDRGSNHALNAVESRAVVVSCLILIVAQSEHACIVSANVQMHWCVHLVECVVTLVLSGSYSWPLAYLMQCFDRKRKVKVEYYAIDGKNFISAVWAND